MTQADVRTEPVVRTPADVFERPAAVAHEIAEEYRGDEDRPLGSFVGVMSVYSGLVAVGALVARRRGVRPEVNLGDIALVGVATHKISRLLARDPVTSPLRAPFTEFKGTSGPAELKEEVRGTGVQKAIGELVTCPFCLGQWVATALGFGLLFAPRATRALCSMFAARAVSDFLQLGYGIAEKKAA
jgi:hypothetical protein